MVVLKEPLSSSESDSWMPMLSSARRWKATQAVVRRGRSGRSGCGDRCIRRRKRHELPSESARPFVPHSVEPRPGRRRQGIPWPRKPRVRLAREQLYVLDGSTNKLTTVTSVNQPVATAPTFSPNGKWLAYSLGQSGAGVAHADGTSPRTITTTAGYPQWLPNGYLIVGTSLYRLLASGQPTPVGSVASRFVSGASRLVAWAMDGSGYAFVSTSSTKGLNGSFHGIERLELAELINGNTHRMVVDANLGKSDDRLSRQSLSGVIVLPHHQGLLFWVDPDLSDVADGMHVYEVRSPGATPVDLGITVGQTVSVGSNGVLAIGSGGNRYAWMTKTIEMCVISTARCSVVHTPAGELTFDPAWAPNGKTLAFIEAPPSNVGNFFQSTLTKWYSTHHLWLLSSGSSVPSEVSGTTGASVPVWSSNGRSLLYESGNALWLIAAPGAAPTKVASPLFWSGAWPAYYGQINWGRQFGWSAS